MLNFMNTNTFHPTFGGPSPIRAVGGTGQMMGSMMMLMTSIMQVMMTLMSQTMGSNPLSGGSPGFGAGSAGMVGGTPSLGGFLGGGPGAAYGGTGSASIPFNSSLDSGGPVGSKVQSFIEAAKSKQGSPYVFGAAGPNAFDCSGLVSWALKQAGSQAPRLTAEGYRQRYRETAVGREQLKPGDLVFFHSANDRGIGPGKATHVEIYLGNGMTMGTDSPKEGAKIEPINWSTFIGGARVPELQS